MNTQKLNNKFYGKTDHKKQIVLHLRYKTNC